MSKFCLLCGNPLRVSQRTLCGEEAADSVAVCPDCKARRLKGRVLFIHFWPGTKTGHWTSCTEEDYPEIKKTVESMKDRRGQLKGYKLPDMYPHSRFITVNEELLHAVSLAALPESLREDVKKLRKDIARQQDEIEAIESELSDEQGRLERMENTLFGYLELGEIARPKKEAKCYHPCYWERYQRSGTFEDMTLWLKHRAYHRLSDGCPQKDPAWMIMRRAFERALAAERKG